MLLGKRHPLAKKAANERGKLRDDDAYDEPEQILRREAHYGFHDAKPILADGISQDNCYHQKAESNHRRKKLLHDKSSFDTYVLLFNCVLVPVEEHILRHLYYSTK